MASVASFDITSTVDLQEVDNALNQARKEVAQRYDFKGARAEIEFKPADKTLVLTADDRMKMEALWEIVQTRLVRRSVPVKNFKAGEIESGSGGTVRRTIEMQQGISERRRARDREVPEGPEAEEGAGRDPGRPGARQRSLEGRPAGSDAPAPRARLRHRAAVWELSVVDGGAGAGRWGSTVDPVYARPAGHQAPAPA